MSIEPTFLNSTEPIAGIARGTANTSAPLPARSPSEQVAGTAHADAIAPDAVTPSDAVTPPSDPAPQTPRYSGRIGGIDIARGLALLGMFWAHMGTFAENGPIRDFISEIPAGRSAILFALLAGVSIAILTGRNIPYTGERLRDARMRIIGRALALLVVSGILSSLGTPIAIIIGYYAMWFLIATLFVHLCTKRLVKALILFAIFGPLANYLAEWLMGSFPILSADPNSALTSALVGGVYPGAVFFVFVLAGIIIGRLDISNRSIQAKIFAAGAVLAIIAYGFSFIATHTFAPDTMGDGEGFSSSMSTSLGDDTWGESAESSNLSSTTASADDEFASKDGSSIDAHPNATCTLAWIDGAPGAKGSGTISKGSLTIDLDGYGSAYFNDDNHAYYCDMNPREGMSSGSSSGSGFDGGYTPSLHSFFGVTPHSGSYFETLGGLGFGMAVLGLCLLIGSLARTVLLPLAALGSMSLTAYSAHVLIAVYPGATSPENAWTWVIVSASLIVLCTVIKIFCKRGPLEYLTWRFSYWFAQMPQPTESVAPTCAPSSDPAPISETDQRPDSFTRPYSPDLGTPNAGEATNPRPEAAPTSGTEPRANQ